MNAATQPVRRWERFGPWLAAAAGMVCFLNSLGNGFTYDDIGIIEKNPRIQRLDRPADIWLSDWWQPTDEEQEVLRRTRDRLYRPLTLFTLALNYAVGGLDPRGYHAVNVFLHAVVCWLVWRFTQRLFGEARLSTIAALVFAVHPVHCEAVANVVGRAEILAALFLLLGSLVLLPSRTVPGVGRAAGAGLFFFAALLSKETAVCYFPVGVLLLHAGAKRPDSPAERRRWWALQAVVLLIPLLVYFPLRYVALDHHLLRDRLPTVYMNPLVWADWPHRLLHAFTILGHYVRLLVFPVKLSANYGLAVIDPDRGPEALTVLGWLAAGASFVALWGYRRPDGTWRRLALLVALSLASYALISNTVLLIGVSLAERLMYWPSVPMLLALIVAALHLWQLAQDRRWLSPAVLRWVRLCGLLLVVALGLRSVVRNADWKNNLTLFGRDVQVYPESAELNEVYASELAWKAKDYVRADRHLQRALEIYPRGAAALRLRGQVLAQLGRRAEAIRCLERAVQLGPLSGPARELLARLRGEAAEEARRLEELKRRVSTQPADADLRLKYGEALLKLGRYDEALSELECAVRLAPENPEALRLLADACIRRNLPQRALELLEKAVVLAPGDWRIHQVLAGLYGRKGEAEPALEHAREAYRLHPDPETSIQLAGALAINGRPAEAVRLYRAVLEHLPEDDPLRPAVEQNLRDVLRRTP